jgi:hypothetical protein
MVFMVVVFFGGVDHVTGEKALRLQVLPRIVMNGHEGMMNGREHLSMDLLRHDLA